jgi:hypothetical protein
LAPPSAEKVLKKSKGIKKGPNPHEITKEMVKSKLSNRRLAIPQTKFNYKK